jgi:hypothetical protein
MEWHSVHPGRSPRQHGQHENPQKNAGWKSYSARHFFLKTNQSVDFLRVMALVALP